MALFMGIDLGTSSVKCILVDEEGQVKADASVEYPMLQPKPGWAEQHPEDWWQATVSCIQNLLSQSPVNKSAVQAIGLSGQMHGSVFLDADLQVIRPALLWCDQRTAEECAWIEQKVGKEQLGRLTGNQALTGFTAPKAIWLRNHEPEHFDRVKHLILPKDYIRLQLTGALGMDVADASGTLLLDVANRRWSEEVCRQIGIPFEWLPPLHESNDVVGQLQPQMAQLLGLKQETMVVAGGGDQACGAVGVGVVKSGIASVALGTSGVVFVHDDEYVADEQYRLHAFCHGVPGKWHRMGVMLAAGGSLQWWKNQMSPEEQRRAKASNQDVYEVLLGDASQASIGSEGLLFLPYLSGERTPHPDPKARGGFIGLHLRHEKSHLTRAIVEGITFGLKDSLQLIEASNISLSEMRVNGGGAKSPFWRQMMADIFGYPVVTVNSTEGPAYGAAVMAASACLQTATTELCNTWIQVVDRHEPDAKAVGKYEEMYEIYRNQYGLLKQTMHELTDSV